VTSMEKVDLVSPVEKAIKMLSNLNLDFFDVYAAYLRLLNIEILGKGIKESMSKIDLGLGIRAYKNKGLGVAYSQSLKDKDIEIIVRQATAFAAIAQPDPLFKGMPGPSKAAEVEGLCDPEVVALTLEEAGGFAKRMLDAVEDVHIGAMYSGSLSAGHSKGYLKTSTGVEVEAEKTSISASVSPTYREGNDIGSSYEYEYAVSLKEIDFEKIGKKAAEKAIEQFGSKQIKSGTLPVILASESSGSLIFGLLGAVSGESAVKGRTFASNCLGKQIAPSFFSVIDDGTIPGAIASGTFDGEGVPRKRIEVVSNGILKNFLHNYYSAGILGVESTGHAVRGGYSGYVGVGPTNIQVNHGDSTLDEMIAETKTGILATNMEFTPNNVSGEFSSTIDEGFFIKNGEKKHPVKNLMVGGYMLELFRDIELVSKEGRTIGKGFFFPNIKLKQIKLAGK